MRVGTGRTRGTEEGQGKFRSFAGEGREGARAGERARGESGSADTIPLGEGKGMITERGRDIWTQKEKSSTTTATTGKSMYPHGERANGRKKKRVNGSRCGWGRA